MIVFSEFKLKLFRLAIDRGYSRKQIEALLSFIDFVVYLPPELNQALKVEFKKEKQKEKKNMEKDYVISPTFDEIFFELIDEKFAYLKEATEELKKVAEEQRKVAEEQRKASARKLLKINVVPIEEVAEIIGISIEEVLEIKSEMDAQN